jgi:hypothetical protein
MARCLHGFEPTAVKCPEGCHDDMPAPPPLRRKSPRRRPDVAERNASRGRAPTFTDQQLAEALRGAKTIAEAADRLGVTWAAISGRQNASPTIKALYDAARAPRLRTEIEGWSHPGFIDLTGHRFGCLEVIERASNSSHGNVRWRVKCGACDSFEIYEGIQLRARRTPARWCRACREKPPGTVPRRAG